MIELFSKWMAACALFLCAPALSGPVYNIDLGVGAGSISGTIELRDGASGSLATSDIEAWQVALDDGVDSTAFGSSSQGASFSLYGGILTFTDTGLYLDFSTTFNSIWFRSENPAARWYFHASADPDFGNGSQVTQIFNIVDNGFYEDFDARLAYTNYDEDTLSIPFATRQSIVPVPEPGSALLLLAGIALLLASRPAAQ